MKKFNSLIYLFPLLMGLIVISNFIYTGIFHYEKFINLCSLEDFGIVGDFFSGHINGFILIALIISLYYQKTSVSQTWEALKQQSLANKTISDDLQNQKKEFFLIAKNNEFTEELKYIQELEREIDLDSLIENDFKLYQNINNYKLIELLKRKEYLLTVLNNLEEESLRESLKHKLDAVTLNKYNVRNKELLNRLFVCNELIKLFNEYQAFILRNSNFNLDNARSFQVIY